MMKYTKSYRSSKVFENYLPVILLVSGIAFISAFSISNYFKNDDLFLELCYSGYWNRNIPVNDFIFQHVGFTSVVRLLYSTGIPANFYFLTHYAVTILCIVLIFERLRKTSSGFLPALLIALALFFYSYVRFTYSVVSGLCVACALLYGKDEKYKSALLLLLGGLIRTEILILALIVCGVHELLNGTLIRSWRIPLILAIFSVLYLTDFAAKRIAELGAKAPLSEMITESSAEFDPKYHDPQSWSMAKNFFFASRYEKRQDLIDRATEYRKNWYWRDWKKKMYRTVEQTRKTIFGKDRDVYILTLSVVFLLGVKFSGRTFLSFFINVAILAVMTNILDVPLLGKERVAIIYILIFFALNREVQSMTWKVLWLLIFINCQFPINTVSYKRNHFDQTFRYLGTGQILFDPLNMITETFPGNYWQANHLKVSPGFTFFPESWTQRSRSFTKFMQASGHKDVYSLMASDNFRFLIPDRAPGWNLIRSPDSVIKVWNTELGAVLGKKLHLVDSVSVVKAASDDSGKKESKYGIYKVD